MRPVNAQRVWARAEQTAAKISFVLAVIGLAEKSYHYVVVAKHAYQHKKRPGEFGFQAGTRTRR